MPAPTPTAPVRVRHVRVLDDHGSLLAIHAVVGTGKATRVVARGELGQVAGHCRCGGAIRQLGGGAIDWRVCVKCCADHSRRGAA